jgi:hypothetical protein
MAELTRPERKGARVTSFMSSEATYYRASDCATGALRSHWRLLSHEVAMLPTIAVVFQESDRSLRRPDRKRVRKVRRFRPDKCRSESLFAVLTHVLTGKLS